MTTKEPEVVIIDIKMQPSMEGVVVKDLNEHDAKLFFGMMRDAMMRAAIEAGIALGSVFKPNHVRVASLHVDPWINEGSFAIMLDVKTHPTDPSERFRTVLEARGQLNETFHIIDEESREIDSLNIDDPKGYQDRYCIPGILPEYAEMRVGYPPWDPDDEERPRSDRLLVWCNWINYERFNAVKEKAEYGSDDYDKEEEEDENE